MSRFLAVVVALALAAAGWFARGWFTSAPAANAETAATCFVARGRLEQNIKSTVGYVRPGPNALVRVGFAALKGAVRPIRFLNLKEGDPVPVGCLLARLDHEDLKMAREQLTAEKDVAQSRLESLQKLEPLDIRQAEAVLAERAAQQDQAQLNYQRKRTLQKDKLVSGPYVEDAANELAVAKARRAQAETALQQVRTKFTADAATLKKQIQQTNTALQAIQTQIQWRELHSPLPTAALVFAVHQRRGELASDQPHLPLMTLLDPNQLEVHLYIAAADVGRIRLPPPPAVTLRAASHPDQILRGKIVRWLPQPVMQDNVVYYLAVVEVNADQRLQLRVDMSVTAHIQAGVKDNVLWLPMAAIRSRADGWYVLQRGSSGLVETPIHIGWQDQGRVEIVEGLAEGDAVLVQS